MGIWVVIDYQFKDAIELLSNPNHKVANPLTDEEISALEKQSSKYFSNLIDRIFNIVASTFLAGLLLSILGYILYNIFK